MGSKAAGKLTEEQFNVVKKAFDLFDLFHHGFIACEDVGRVMLSLGQNLTQDEMKDAISELDAGNGFVDFQSFLNFMAPRMKLSLLPGSVTPLEDWLNQYTCNQDIFQGYMPPPSRINSRSIDLAESTNPIIPRDHVVDTGLVPIYDFPTGVATNADAGKKTDVYKAPTVDVFDTDIGPSGVGTIHDKALNGVDVFDHGPRDLVSTADALVTSGTQNESATETGNLIKKKRSYRRKKTDQDVHSGLEKSLKPSTTDGGNDFGKKTKYQKRKTMDVTLSKEKGWKGDSSSKSVICSGATLLMQNLEAKASVLLAVSFTNFVRGTGLTDLVNAVENFAKVEVAFSRTAFRLLDRSEISCPTHTDSDVWNPVKTNWILSEELSCKADRIVVIASAETLGKIAMGLAGNLVTVLSSCCPTDKVWIIPDLPPGLWFASCTKASP